MVGSNGAGAQVRRETWELVNLSDGHCPITLKWVYKLKKDEQGAVIQA